MMSDTPTLSTTLRELRTRRGWSQDEVARRSGLSRAGVSAIETGRLVPSTAAALALAAAFDCHVEDLFRLHGPGAARPGAVEWAWTPSGLPCRYWLAEVGGRTRAYPAEATAPGTVPHDGIARDDSLNIADGIDPGRTLVLACCDPAAGLLSSVYKEASGFRLLVLPRSSSQALDLLERGLAHVAGVHLATAANSDGNIAAVHSRFREGMALLRVSGWEEGLVLAPNVDVRTVGSALRARLSWVGRERGSGARQCLDELLAGRPAPRRVAFDHRGVAEAIRCGWAEAGVCHRLAAEDAGLKFLGFHEERYDLCYRRSDESDPRIRALIQVIRSRAYRSLLSELPGYDPREAGEVEHISLPRSN
jgi:molybdate-binding protein/transcriptional regulator with XRE-family HTH domain